MRELGTAIGYDKLEHVHTCAHCGMPEGATLSGLMSHSTGIAAHVAIYLKPCVDIWEAYQAFAALKVPGVHVEKIHVSLGEIDMLADIHAPWTTPMGMETRMIGNWVNAVRTAKPAEGHAGECECCFVARTSTNVCMSPD
jgi:hypothetical protein